MRMLINNLPSTSESEKRTFDRWVIGQSIFGHQGKVVFYADISVKPS